MYRETDHRNQLGALSPSLCFVLCGNGSLPLPSAHGYVLGGGVPDVSYPSWVGQEGTGTWWKVGVVEHRGKETPAEACWLQRSQLWL